MPFRATRQPDPTPTIAAEHPSLVTYVVLVLVASGLVGIAFAERSDWPGLAANLATEFLGAVIILLIVERRIRDSEMRRLASLAPLGWRYLFSPEKRDLLRYARALIAELESIRPEPYLRREALETVLEDYLTGFVLIGDPGMGKTVLLQDLVLKQARRLAQDPRRERVPVLLPMRKHVRAKLETNVWYEGVRPHFGLSSRTVKRMLRAGRLAVFLDGMDESPKREVAVADANELLASFPLIYLVASTRSGFPVVLGGLPEVVIPRLSADELRELHR